MGSPTKWFQQWCFPLQNKSQEDKQRRMGSKRDDVRGKEDISGSEEVSNRVDTGSADYYSMDRERLGWDRKWEAVTNVFSFLPFLHYSLCPLSLSYMRPSQKVEERKHINEVPFSTTFHLLHYGLLPHSPFAIQRLSYQNISMVLDICTQVFMGNVIIWYLRDAGLP